MSVTRDWDPMDNDISEGHTAEAQSSHLWGQGLGTQGEGRGNVTETGSGVHTCTCT